MSTKPHYERAFFKLIYTPRIFEFTSRLFRFLGRGFYAAVARSVAWSYAVTQHGVREIVRRNLELLMPGKARGRDAVKVFTTFGATIADYVAVGNMEQAEAEKWRAESLGSEHSRRRAGRGAARFSPPGTSDFSSSARCCSGAWGIRDRGDALGAHSRAHEMARGFSQALGRGDDRGGAGRLFLAARRAGAGRGEIRRDAGRSTIRRTDRAHRPARRQNRVFRVAGAARVSRGLSGDSP